MKKNILLIFIPIVLVYLFALPIPPMEMDAAQYAAMTLEMLEKGDWLHFTDLGKPYLDKPPLVFWLTGISYKLLGISPVSYKLPSLLFWLLTLWSLYRFAKRYYSQNIALTATFILATSQAAFLMTNDCRTDTLLTGAVTFSIWQLAAYWEKRQWQYFLGAFVGIGLAMLAKGPIGAMIPAWTFGAHFLFTKQGKAFLHWQWIGGISIILLVLSPMIWGLYTQFDLHPELLVNGKIGVSGLRFYFWTQSFGRITGENTWTNNSGYGYFLHTSLWAFLPWGFLLFVSLISHGFAQIRFRLGSTTEPIHTEKTQEYLSLAGFVLTFIAFSLSKYKLPHYIFVVYPLAAILIAVYLEKILVRPKWLSFWFWTQNIIGGILFMAAFGICAWVFFSPFYLLLCSIFLLLFLGTIWVSFFWLKGKYEIPLLSEEVKRCFPSLGFLLPSFIMMVAINSIANLHFYPKLLEYQSSTKVGNYIVKQNLPKDKIFIVTFYSTPDIFIGKRVRNFREEFAAEWTKDGPIYIYAPQDYAGYLQSIGKKVEILQTFEDFKITHLTFAFLNPKTRQSVLKKRVLIKLYG